MTTNTGTKMCQKKNTHVVGVASTTRLEALYKRREDISTNPRAKPCGRCDRPSTIHSKSGCLACVDFKIAGEEGRWF